MQYKIDLFLSLGLNCMPIQKNASFLLLMQIQHLILLIYKDYVLGILGVT